MVSRSALSLAREYWSDLVYQLSQPPVCNSICERKVLSEKACVPVTRMLRILATSPSTTEKVTLMRFFSTGVMVVTTSAPYRLRVRYWRLSSCSARSAWARSNGKPSPMPTSRKALTRTSLSNSLVPVNSTLAITGRSSTTTTTTPPSIWMRTSLNRPVPNRARRPAAPLSSV